jgi:uncharacterized protein YggE
MSSLRPTRFLALAVVVAAALALLLAWQPRLGPVGAQEPSDQDRRRITVIATGNAEGRPDQATLRVGAQAVRPTAAEALAEANRVVETVLAKLDELGIPRADVQTSALNLLPIRERPGQPAEGEGQISGYRASDMLTVRVADLARVGQVLDGAVAAGANQVGGVHFGLGDASALHGQALQDAVGSARGEAEVIAGPLGLRVGPVLSVEEVGGPTPVPLAAPAAKVAGATPIEPGQLTAQARVRVTFAVAENSP